MHFVDWVGASDSTTGDMIAAGSRMKFGGRAVVALNVCKVLPRLGGVPGVDIHGAGADHSTRPTIL